MYEKKPLRAVPYAGNGYLRLLRKAVAAQRAEEKKKLFSLFFMFFFFYEDRVFLGLEIKKTKLRRHICITWSIKQFLLCFFFSVFKFFLFFLSPFLFILLPPWGSRPPIWHPVWAFVRESSEIQQQVQLKPATGLCHLQERTYVHVAVCSPPT